MASMVCTSGTVDILHIVVFVSINNLTTLGQHGVSCILCTSGTVDLLSVILFVSVHIVYLSNS